jgi:hypothetical protein
MLARLKTEPACFSVNIQLQGDRQAMPVEDPTVEWSTLSSPFVPVADIRIAPQTFDTPERNAYCENLSYSPWHAVPDLRPAGSINRIRRAVYLAIQRLRHGLNDAPPNEPTVADFATLDGQK